MTAARFQPAYAELTTRELSKLVDNLRDLVAAPHCTDCGRGASGHELSCARRVLLDLAAAHLDVRFAEGRP